MKRFITLSVLAWFLGWGQATADEIIINDINMPQGGSADLVVKFKSTTSSKKVGATFCIQLPEGLSFARDTDGEVVCRKDKTSTARMNVVNMGAGNFALLPGSATARIDGTTGTLLTLHVVADGTIPVGTSMEVKVTKVSIASASESAAGVRVSDIPLGDFTFKVNIGEPNGEPTDINGIDGSDGSQTDGTIFTLGGQQVGKNVKTNQLKKGIYIRDGKKAVVK